MRQSNAAVGGKVQRQILAGLLAVVMGISAWSSVGHAAVLGDCNGDGQVRSVDALLSLQYAANLIPHTPESDAHYLACADVAPLDVNLVPVGDRLIRSADSLVILQRAAQLLNFQVQVPSAILKISTTGTLPPGTSIGAIDATVTYPTSKSLTIFDTDITASTGAGTGTNCSPTNQTCYMMVANTTTVFGQVKFGLINPTGIAAVGELATMNFHTAPGEASPLKTDFAIAPGATVYDAAGVLIPGVSVTISSASIQ